MRNECRMKSNENVVALKKWTSLVLEIAVGFEGVNENVEGLHRGSETETFRREVSNVC